MKDHRTDDSYIVQPGTDEYDVISFLVHNRRYRFTLSELASALHINEERISEIVSHFLETGIVERVQERYYVDIESAKDLQQRLESIDAAERLHNTAPDDDAYAEQGWENELPSLYSERSRT